LASYQSKLWKSRLKVLITPLAIGSLDLKKRIEDPFLGFLSREAMTVNLKGGFMNINKTSESAVLSSTNLKFSQRTDPFDLDVQKVRLNGQFEPRGVVTSKFLCTPGCGNTGTGNSFCCSCK
jgi:gallidermin/nisin family lantibiotic